MNLLTSYRIIHKILGRERNVVFLVLSGLAVFTNLLDLALLQITVHNPIFLVNVLNVIAIIIAMILRWKKISTLQTSGSVVIYTIMTNLCISQYFGESQINFEAHFLRQCLFSWIIIVCAGFIINRHHVLIVSCIQILQLIMAFAVKNPYIEQNAITILMAMLIYSGSVYYITLLLERYYSQSRKHLENLSSEKSTLREIEIALKQNNETQNQLFSIISHDLKNQSNLLLNFSRLLPNKIEQNQLDSATKMANAISQAANTNNELLINLLEWSKTQTNSFKYKPQETDLDELFRIQSLESEFALEAKNITLNIQNSIKEPQHIDPVMFSSTIRNLLSNAIKFSPNGEVVTLKAEEFQKYITVSITDRGVGVSPQKIKQLLKDNTTQSTRGTANEKGTGLGFSICRFFVAQHDGTISIGSVEGKGTQVQINIPKLARPERIIRTHKEY